MLSLIELAKEGKLEKTGAKPKLPIKIDGVSSETLDAIDGQLLVPEYTDDYLQEVKDIVIGRYK